MAQLKTKQKSSQKAPIGRPAVLSQEKIVDSDSDSAKDTETVSRNPASKKRGPVQKSIEKNEAPTNGKKHVAPVLSSDEETADEEIANEEDDAVEDEASEEESENESKSVPSKITKRPASPVHATPAPRKKVKPTPPTDIAPKPFKPPYGFEKTTLSASDYAAGSTEFLIDDLTRKQIWHITAPVSVNIRDIKPFDIQDVRSGKPILSKNGVDYGFLTGSHKTEKLLLASGEGAEYAQAGVPISGTYHLREIGRSKANTNADGDKENSNISFAARSIVTSKKPREQPVGLRMRYQPYGSVVASKGPGSSSTLRPTFHMLPELPESQLDKSARKKARKEKKASQQAKESSQNADSMDLDPTPSSTVKNPESGKASESATRMVDKVFEAATETPSQETKRKKKKKHRIAEEVSL